MLRAEQEVNSSWPLNKSETSNEVWISDTPSKCPHRQIYRIILKKNDPPPPNKRPPPPPDFLVSCITRKSAGLKKSTSLLHVGVSTWFSHGQRVVSVGVKWNESGFRPFLFTYRINWARITSWGCWEEWDDTALQTHDSKFKPWSSDSEHATSRTRRLPTILSFTSVWGKNIFVSFKLPRSGNEPRTLAWKAAVLTSTLGPPPERGCKRGLLLLHVV